MPTDIPPAETKNDAGSVPAPFFVLSARKLILLDLTTFGVYKLIWFYRNWQVISAREKRPLQAFWRALFAAIFSYSLFRYIEIQAQRAAIGVMLPAGLLTASIWLFSVPGVVNERYSFVSPLTLLPVLYANNVAHRVNWHHDAHFVAEEHFTPLQHMCVVIGVILWGLVLQSLWSQPVGAP